MGRNVSDLKVIVDRERAAFAERLVLSDEIAPGIADPCILYDGPLDAGGHPTATYRGKRQRARRVAHQLSHRCVLAPEIKALPRCGVKRCIHPNHTDLVDESEAGRRSWANRKERKPLHLPSSLESARRALERAEHQGDLAERRIHAHRANVLALEAADAMAS